MTKKIPRNLPPGRRGQGWHFLTGRRHQKLADAVGFDTDIHVNADSTFVAVTFILTPDGRLSRYLYGVEYDPDLRLSLEAAEGKIGSTADQFSCFAFTMTRKRPVRPGR